ncbi:hypothetical protein EKD16_14975 [Streptomonospora litoralis]|uniref:Uncharacterized protein n=1 Tax=Streptomonospora litoralis TaxID=2498135 RepID=A0A4P6Q2M7_9ACTN|nr:hypothetical protein EKD16_14975 [Streptomonospora litoralis]
MVAGFAVSLGLAIAIGFSADMTMITRLGSSDEPHSDAEMIAAIDVLWGLRRPVALLLPTVLGIIAIVKAVQSRRTEGPSASSVMAILLAVSGPFITTVVFVAFYTFGVHTALMAGDM